MPKSGRFVNPGLVIDNDDSQPKLVDLMQGDVPQATRTREIIFRETDK